MLRHTSLGYYQPFLISTQGTYFRAEEDPFPTTTSKKSSAKNLAVMCLAHSKATEEKWIVTAIINGLTFHCTAKEKISGKAATRDWGEGACTTDSIQTWKQTLLRKITERNTCHPILHIKFGPNTGGSLKQLKYSKLKETNKRTIQVNSWEWTFIILTAI